MDKKEIGSLNEAYNGVPRKKVILKEAPYSKLGAWWDRTRSGRGDSPVGAGAKGGAALGALVGGLPGAALGAIGGGIAGKATDLLSDPEAYGMSELKDETNIVWDQFRREVLSMNPNPKGKRILNWFKNQLQISPDVIPSLKRNIDPKKRYKDDSKLEAIFKDALRDAQIYHYTGGLDKTSLFATDPAHLITVLLSLDDYAWNNASSKHQQRGRTKRDDAGKDATEVGSAAMAGWDPAVPMGGRPVDVPQQTLDVLNFIFYKLGYMDEEMQRQSSGGLQDAENIVRLKDEVAATQAKLEEVEKVKANLPSSDDFADDGAAKNAAEANQVVLGNVEIPQDIAQLVAEEDPAIKEYLDNAVDEINADIQMDLPLKFDDDKPAA
jgi:hypothetical protein